MQRIEYSHMDKSDWGVGPWLKEPDKVQWQDETTRLPCMIVRNQFGCWCGYVGVSKGHPFYEKDYNHEDVYNLVVHGSLTFSGKCQSHDGDQETLACKSICHIVEPDEDDDVWWFGFDCAHWQDLAPAMNAYRDRKRFDGENYRNMVFVTMEVESLAEQLKEMVNVASA